MSKINRPTNSQMFLIEKMERALADYYGDWSDRFTGRTHKDASEWIQEKEEQYQCVRWELSHGHGWAKGGRYDLSV